MYGSPTHQVTLAKAYQINLNIARKAIRFMAGINCCFECPPARLRAGSGGANCPTAQVPDAPHQLNDSIEALVQRVSLSVVEKPFFGNNFELAAYLKFNSKYSGPPQAEIQPRPLPDCTRCNGEGQVRQGWGGAYRFGLENLSASFCGKFKSA